jgi:hypothetical protein
MILRIIASIVIATVVISIDHFVSNAIVTGAAIDDALIEANEQLDSLLRNSTSLGTVNDTLNGTTNITTIGNDTATYIQ